VLLLLAIFLTVNATLNSGVKLGSPPARKAGDGTSQSAQPEHSSPGSPSAQPQASPAAAAPGKPDCSKSAAPQVQANDFEVRDPNTCTTIWVGQSAVAIQKMLDRTYEIKALPPNSDTAVPCMRTGDNTNVNGKSSTMLGICDSTKTTYVATQKGIAKFTTNTTAPLVWFALAATAAPRRFSTPAGQMCAAGFALSHRPGAAQSDLDAVKGLKIEGWSDADPFWKYVQQGMEFSASGKDIKGCGPEAPDIVYV
jgi:hypothetical protein